MTPTDTYATYDDAKSLTELIRLCERDITEFLSLHDYETIEQILGTIKRAKFVQKCFPSQEYDLDAIKHILYTKDF